MEHLNLPTAPAFATVYHRHRVYVYSKTRYADSRKIRPSVVAGVMENKFDMASSLLNQYYSTQLERYISLAQVIVKVTGARRGTICTMPSQ